MYLSNFNQEKQQLLNALNTQPLVNYHPLAKEVHLYLIQNS